MSINTSRTFNNDNTPHFAAFQARFQEMKKEAFEATAAAKLHSAPPSPTQLSEHQATETAQNIKNIPQNMTQQGVHNNIDPERVKRLLSLLD